MVSHLSAWFHRRLQAQDAQLRSFRATVVTWESLGFEDLAELSHLASLLLNDFSSSFSSRQDYSHVNRTSRDGEQREAQVRMEPKVLLSHPACPLPLSRYSWELSSAQLGGWWLQGQLGMHVRAGGCEVHGFPACLLWLGCQGNKGEMPFPAWKVTLTMQVRKPTID